MKRIPCVLSTAFALVGLFSSTSRAESVSLAGSWRFSLDRNSEGESQLWFNRSLGQTIKLPGDLTAQGVGDEVAVTTQWTGGIFDRTYFTADAYAPYRKEGNIKVPFWLQPERHYTGCAWYQRDLDIPVQWKGQRIILSLERVHWKSHVWLDQKDLGSRDSLSVAHEYELGALTAGQHTLTIQVDNRLDPDIGENSHSVSDHTQGNWNGVIGRIELRATKNVWIDSLQVFPHVADRTALVQGHIERSNGTALPSRISLVADLENSPRHLNAEGQVGPDGNFSATIELGADANLWDEFSPAIYQLRATPEGGEPRETSFGLREIGTNGRQLTINGRKLFLRGTLDCAAFPRTGHPPTDLASWKREFQTIRAHGLNHIRFHSWCPPEAAFRAADELGFYLQIEAASWPNWSTTLGDGKPVDSWIEAETQRILAAYGNHPSFVLFSACNEPGGKVEDVWLAGWVSRRKATDSRRLYTSGSGWPELVENDYHVTSEPHIQHWGEGLKSRINSRAPETESDYSDYILARKAPVVSHEIGQWCAFPNFDEMKKYTGYLKPKNFEIFQASLAAHHLSGQAQDFLIASGKLQTLCYKEDIESALRTPGMGGFQLLGLSDFPGQGTALVGVLDAFWEEKGYVTPSEFRRFSGSVVPLARLSKRVYTADETLQAKIEISHFGPKSFKDAVTEWKLVGDDTKVAATGRFNTAEIAIGAAQPIGQIDVSLKHLPAPARYKLVVSLDGTPFENDWDIWVYPPAREVVTPPPLGLLITTQFDEKAHQTLDLGGVVWLTLPSSMIKPDPQKGKIALGFSSIFWNTAWTNGQAPHTLGILCDPKHPALAEFPTDPWSNWQWWYPLQSAQPMIIDALPDDIKPIVQVVDDWFTNRKLALVFEARVGKGRLLVTSIDLGDGQLDPVRRQLRASLLHYIGSSHFLPKSEVLPSQIAELVGPNRG